MIGLDISVIDPDISIIDLDLCDRSGYIRHRSGSMR